MTANQANPCASAGVPCRALIERHARLAELALSFPPLLFTLALPRPGLDPEPAIVRAIQGRPLREMAAAAGIPLWLRRLPVEGLTRPLPALLLHQHDLLSIRPEPRKRRDSQPDIATWRRLWRPYWCAKRRIPAWLPLTPSWKLVHALG